MIGMSWFILKYIIIINKNMKILENKFFQILIFVLMIVVIVFFLAVIKDKFSAPQSDVITVTGTGDAYATPDIGLIDISVLTQDKVVSTASDENSKKMNDIIAYVKGAGVEEKDIKTINFNISPIYSYESRTGKRNLDGYQVSQSLEVKIRDLSKVGDIISNATSLGANDISSLTFIVDNDELVKEQAKSLAIADAKTKAKNLEKELGIKLGKIVNFSEGTYPSPTYAYGLGGAMEMKSASSISPTIQTGQNKVTSNVTITYSIR